MAYSSPKDDKKKQPEKVATGLRTQQDSISYAAGMAMTNGLVPYLQNQYGVTTENLPYFIEGFKEAMERARDPKYIAKSTGFIIAQMAEKNIFPQANQPFAGTDKLLDSKKFYEGFVAGVTNDTTYYQFNDANEYFSNASKAALEKKNKEYKEKNENWLKENAKKDGVKTTASGLQYKVIKAGTGNKPSETDNVTVKYEGKLIDGVVFDSSYKRNPQTTSFRVDRVIKGWTEALTMMREGSKWELYIPQNLGYGERQAGQIHPYSTLIFTVELIKVEKSKETTGKE